MTRDRLIFVYNAEAGLLAGVLDSVHKTLSPSTYACSLCAVTHGIFTMDRRWRAWLATLPVTAVFHHRPDFHAAFPEHRALPLPLVALENAVRFEVLLDATTLAAVPDVDALIAALDAALGATRSNVH